MEGERWKMPTWKSVYFLWNRNRSPEVKLRSLGLKLPKMISSSSIIKRIVAHPSSPCAWKIFATALMDGQVKRQSSFAELSCHFFWIILVIVSVYLLRKGKPALEVIGPSFLASLIIHLRLIKWRCHSTWSWWTDIPAMELKFLIPSAHWNKVRSKSNSSMS